MASITQQINNYKSGISELPDELKSPGQVVDLKNALPDIVRGCIKRPGSDLVSTITPAANGKWFSIYSQEDEQYIGQVATTGAVKVWRCSDGVEIPVDYANVDGTNLATYLIHSNSNEIQPLTINEATFFCNRTKTVAMKTDTASKSKPQEKEAYVALRTISYGKQYALDIFDPTDHSTVIYNRATSIEAKSDVDVTTHNGSYSNDGKCTGAGRYVVGPTDTDIGVGVSRGGVGRTNLRYEMDCRCTPIPQAGASSNNYDDSYQPHAQLQFGGEGWKTGDTHNHVSEKLVETQVEVKSHVEIESRANVALVRPTPSSSNSYENVSAETIIADMKNAIDNIYSTGLQTTKTGNGLHLHRDTDFNVTTTETQLMDIITNEANAPDDLPRTCRHGFVVKVVNSGEDQDDYYLKFKVKNIAENITQSDCIYTRGASGSKTGTYTRGGQQIITTSKVSTGDDTITWDAHPFATAEAIVYQDGGGTALAGLTDNTTYYVIKVDKDTIKLATNTSNANAGTAINLTGTGNNSQTIEYNRDNIVITHEDHGLKHGDQIVATFTGGGTNGTYTISNVLKDSFEVTDASSGIIASNAVSYTHGIATVTKATHGLDVNDSLIADFISGGATDGWYEIDTVADVNTLTFRQSVPTNIGGTVATSGVNTGTEVITLTTHGFSTGDAVHYSNGGGTTLAGLTDDTKYYCIRLDANTFKLATTSALATAGTAINLTGTGNNSQKFSAYLDITPNRFGEGVWEECAGPDLEIKFDVDTMPLKMTRVLPGTFSINGGGATSYANGAFRFAYPEWDDRDVGDDITNPKPSFVDNKINKIFFYRNRIGLLSEENVILSRTNDFHNFWAKTAFTIANADPIDLQSSSLYPTELFDAIEVNAGLLIFSASQQFLLKTDESQLTPETAMIAFLSSYAFNEKTSPFSLGTTAGWLNSTAKRTRFHEMASIVRNGEPQVLEQTKPISKLFPDDITLIAESTENSLVLFASEDKNEVWGYNFYNQGQNRIQSAWFRWLLPGTVTYHTMMDDLYHVVLKNGSTYTLQTFDIKTASDTEVIGTAPDEHLVHLDTKSNIASSALGYSATDNRTGFTKPSGYDNAGQLAVYCNTAGDNLGKYALASTVGSNLEFDGDWTGQDIVLGYLYEYEVELPTIYIQQASGERVMSETRGSLTVHRVNFSFGPVGLIDVTLKRKGRPDYNKSYESTEWDVYSTNTSTIVTDHIHTIPVYDKNINLSLHLNSTHPTPATLHSMTWEGDYNPKFYQRV